MLVPPANMVGGSSTPLGRPVVPDVYIRLGRGDTSVGGSAGARPLANQLSHGVSPGSSGQRQPDDERRRRPAAAAPARSAAVSGPTNEHAGAGVLEDVGQLLRR